MTTSQIQDIIKAKKLSEGKLARRFRVSKSSIHFLIHRKFKSERLEKRLARVLGVTVEELRGTDEGKAA